jgi:ParB family transcriptional regulator, chromosome partitioning protein
MVARFACGAGTPALASGGSKKAKEGSMGQPTTAVLDIERIDVEDGFNPRTRFDDDRLTELEATIRRDGLLTALTVVPTEGDRYTLVARERRLIAARRAGLEQVPVVVRASRKGSRAAALVENLIREDLDPIDMAQGLADLAEKENLTTHRQIAERIGKKNVGWVSEHLRLLRLPDKVRHHVAAGHVPIAAEKVLREASRVSPRVAECACELAACGTVDGRDLVDISERCSSRWLWRASPTSRR